MSKITDARLDEMLASTTGCIGVGIGDWPYKDRSATVGEIHAILTQLRALRSSAGAVKALEWESIGPDGSDIEAVTVLGTYTLSFDAFTAGGAVNLYVAGADVDTFTVHESRASAKAAAQADYERRILSALTPVHTPNAEQVTAMQEALRTLLSINDNHGPFGGEMYQDRIDRAWDKARLALQENTNGK